MAGFGDGAALRASPWEEVRDFFFARQNHIAELDDAAERCAADWGLLPGRADEALAQRLLQAVGAPQQAQPQTHRLPFVGAREGAAIKQGVGRGFGE